MTYRFELAACAEMLWPEKTIDWRASRLKELGFGVGLWNWPEHDINKLQKTGATFTIMNGYLEGALADDEGAQQLIKSIEKTIIIGKKLGVQRLNLHGTGLGDGGIPKKQASAITQNMWIKASDTLNRICDLAEKENVVFTLENLNLLDHPGCPFNSTADVLRLVSGINRTQLRMNLDLYHTQIGEGDIIRWCEKCLNYIGEIQVADNPGRCEPGSGEMNYEFVAGALYKMGYRGPVGLEAYASNEAEMALEKFKQAFTIQVD